MSDTVQLLINRRIVGLHAGDVVDAHPDDAFWADQVTAGNATLLADLPDEAVEDALDARELEQPAHSEVVDYDQRDVEFDDDGDND